MLCLVRNKPRGPWYRVMTRQGTTEMQAKREKSRKPELRNLVKIRGRDHEVYTPSAPANCCPSVPDGAASDQRPAQRPPVAEQFCHPESDWGARPGVQHRPQLLATKNLVTNAPVARYYEYQPDYVHPYAQQFDNLPPDQRWHMEVRCAA